MIKNEVIEFAKAIVQPKWQNLPNILAFTTLAQLNGKKLSFSGNSKDSIEARKNIQKLLQPCAPIKWLKQVHGNRILRLPEENNIEEADGAVTNKKYIPCVILTADCLPVIFATADGKAVGAAHAGWRGLVSGVIPNTVRAFNDNPSAIYVWLGPAIGYLSFEVGYEVYDRFIKSDTNNKKAFKSGRQDKYYANLYELAHMQLIKAGVNKNNITSNEYDTFTNPLFHSARRNGAASGRMATIVMIT
ncbi:MAG: peptidoglycan editing factor PgeF [Deltaproteobacteria bacterium]|nr:peptidoglycan editing factor PgeF [Deltaproteobacteria bacterium]